MTKKLNQRLFSTTQCPNNLQVVFAINFFKINKPQMRANFKGVVSERVLKKNRILNYFYSEMCEVWI